MPLEGDDNEEALAARRRSRALARRPLAQDKPVLVVQVFTTAAGVALPYDMKLMQAQIIPEFKVMLGKDFDVVAEAPAAPASQGLHPECRNHRLASWQRGQASARRDGLRS